MPNESVTTRILLNPIQTCKSFDTSQTFSDLVLWVLLECIDKVCCFCYVLSKYAKNIFNLGHIQEVNPLTALRAYYNITALMWGSPNYSCKKQFLTITVDIVYDVLVLFVVVVIFAVLVFVSFVLFFLFFMNLKYSSNESSNKLMRLAYRYSSMISDASWPLQIITSLQSSRTPKIVQNFVPREFFHAVGIWKSIAWTKSSTKRMPTVQ